MKNEHIINKNMIYISIFVLLFGLAILLSRSNIILKLHTDVKQDDRVVDEKSALSEQEEQNFKNDRYLVIYDPNEKGSEKLKSNIAQTLKYMKKNTEATTIKDIPSNLDDYKSIIFAVAQINGIQDMSLFQKYVYDGGGIFFAIRPEIGNSLFSIYRNLGINELGNFTTTEGIHLTSDILINNKGLSIPKEAFLLNSSLSLKLDEAVSVHMKSEKGLPLLWDTNYGKGKFMVFNGTFLSSKDNRGIISGALSYLQEDYIYPIMNSKLVYIDDFPAPLPPGTNKLIFRDYGIDTRTFYQTVWWKDMQEIADSNDIKYTGVLIETYNNWVKPSFVDRSGIDKDSMVMFGRELLKMGGEIGIHGYNHQSLTLDQHISDKYSYMSWKSEKNIVEALNEAEYFLNMTLPGYVPKTYVPPSNVLSEQGKAAIQKALPSIKIISSLYIEDPTESAYVQEFEKKGKFIEMPRLTSGYEDSNENKWLLSNGITSLGMFSHFIHPDDILDENRGNSKSWNELSTEFSHIMKDTKNRYPWLQSKVAARAGTDLEHYLKTKIYIQQDNDKIDVFVNDFVPPLYFVLRSSKEISSIDGGKITKMDSDHVLIKAEREHVTIGFK
ncbi:DUF2194 domain-containing protein [Bacillus sp. V5-8f]|uniref:DUF2194 domain-containing protein n=1 Tax=Bacillus sp. V5-8f TaxID=2053044 RepID=UPI000C76DFA7|nr:DUF2194 domain-containing protein [Bacillus sp. V5-8f]PLT32608.1 hypothetical protein CUU64_18230 [Bacillus sp. V5-8f]